MEECQAYDDDNFKYSYYIHGHLIPWRDQQREMGKLIPGKTVFFYSFGLIGTATIRLKYGLQFEYEGELDEHGNPCGYGEAKY